MEDKVIITLCCLNQEFDMEMPGNTKIERIKPVIAQAFGRKGIEPAGRFSLVSRGYPLKETDTLLGAGVWDGSYLEIVSEG